MKRLWLWFVGVVALSLPLGVALAHKGLDYSNRLCNLPQYYCITVAKGESWSSILPNEIDRDVVKRLNRMNIRLYPGMVIAIPRDLARTDVFDISPMPSQIDSSGGKTVIVNQDELAWGAYDAAGNLVKWGPMAGGKNYCPDVRRSCKTVKGTFTFYTKRGAGCRSSKYPVGKGGAKMPYCMFFHRGYAMHGSPTVPGHHASHGCVRMFDEDAKWLNLEFIELGSTKIIIR